jgi:hypothetical protein
MNNLILFLNEFLSYILLMIIIVAVAAVAMFIGIKWRKAKDAKAALEEGDLSQAAQTKME